MKDITWEEQERLENLLQKSRLLTKMLKNKKTPIKEMENYSRVRSENVWISLELFVREEQQMKKVEYIQDLCTRKSTKGKAFFKGGHESY